jgi:hypothetical protein
MGRIVSVRIPEHYMEAVEAFAEHSDTTTSQVILWAIKDLVPGIVDLESKQPRRKPREKMPPKVEEMPLAKGAYGRPYTGRIVRDEYSPF